ncbi:winged helix-turn-helix domain-containing protein [Patescibacteria group bacterium]|nr:winged helix-turn-helix domain-containing protein [Patescibacteria group bacterium]MBU1953134.1 winged helix-turn-helix domain-containing protein [Patescibacteria group bacterium]
MLNKILVSEVRVKILKLLLLNPKRSFHIRAIVRNVDAEINAVRRELENLFEVSLVTRRQSSNKIFYQINTEHPFYTELLSLVAKEDGVGAAIMKKAPQIGDISYAMLSLEFLRGRKSSALDVDLFIVGSVNLDILSFIIKEEEEKMGREINYSVMGIEEFLNRKRTNDSFIYRILTQSRTMLVGDDSKFCETV